MKLRNEFFKITSQEENTCTVEFCSNHVIYQAHFPGHPITPGVCIIEVVTEILEQRLGEPLELSIVKNLKFSSAISPIDDKTVTVDFSSIEKDHLLLKVKGCITGNEKIYTKFSFIYKK